MKKIFFLVTAMLCMVLLAAGCEAAPDLNRPWNTATPQFASNSAAPGLKNAPAAAAVSTPAVSLAGASSAETIQFAGAADNPPFMYADENGNPTGLYKVLLEAIFERMGKRVNITPYPWNRAVEVAQSGELPLAGIYKNEERLKIFDYSDALYPNQILIYVPKGKAFAFEGPADLAGKSVGTMAGWTYGDTFDQLKTAGTFTVEEVASDSDNLEKLVLGRLDCVAAESTIAQQIIAEKGYADQVEALPVPLIVFDAYVVFAKSANQTEFIETFNETLAAMKQDGSYDKVIAGWSEGK